MTQFKPFIFIQYSRTIFQNAEEVGETGNIFHGAVSSGPVFAKAENLLRALFEQPS